MYQFDSQASLIIHGLITLVIIGVFYNLMVTTKVYGGVIGKAIRLIGVAAICVTIGAIERILISFAVIQPTFVSSMIIDVMTLFSLVFLGLGFSKLASAGKQ